MDSLSHLGPPNGPEEAPSLPPSYGLLHIRRKRPRPIPTFKKDGQGRRGQVVRRPLASGEQLS
jgi:hypothetical protein